MEEHVLQSSSSFAMSHLLPYFKAYLPILLPVSAYVAYSCWVISLCKKERGRISLIPLVIICIVLGLALGVLLSKDL